MRKTRCANLFFSEHGGALLIALSIMLLILMAALTAVNTAHTDIELTFNQLHSDKAFYVAEAGLNRALIQLVHENQWTTGYLGETFEDGVYSVAVAHSDVDSLIVDTVIVRSTGIVEQSVANLEAIIVPELWFPFRFAMFGKDSLTMTNNCCTDSYNSDSGTYVGTALNDGGDVASNGIIDLTNSAVVGGDASAADTGGLSVCATCSVLGDTASGVAPYTIEPIPDSQFTYAHTNNSAPGGLSGSYSYDGATHDLTLATNEIVQLSGGIYYFNEVNLGIGSQFKVAPDEKVIIYMTGDLLVQNNTSVNSAGTASDLMIFSQGSIFTMGMSIDITASFYGPDADVFVGNGCNFYGSVVGKSVIMDNAACAHYDRALAECPAGTTGRMIMIAWREM